MDILEKRVGPVLRVEEYFCMKLGGIIFNRLVVANNHSVKNLSWIASGTAEAMKQQAFGELHLI